MADQVNQGKGPEQPPEVPSPEVSPASPHVKESGEAVRWRFEYFKRKCTKKCLLRWGPFAIQLVLALVGISALVIYHGQLAAMRGQLTAIQTGSTQTDILICLYRQQLQRLTEQSNDVHELAIQAKNQSDSTRSLAGDTLTQAKATNKIAAIAHETYLASVRPYLGVGIGDIISDKVGKLLKFDVVVKNAGSIPATGVDFSVHPFLNGRYIEFPKGPDQPTAILPGLSLRTPVSIPNQPIPFYDAITSGRTEFELHISVIYHWPGHHASFCQIERYDPNFGHFMDIGPVCKPWKSR